MLLYLCEKPSQARDIAKNLGLTTRNKGYIGNNTVAVTWCIGHLLSQVQPDAYDPKYKTWSMNTLPIVPKQWRMEVSKHSADQFRAVKGLLGKATGVVIATDIDREGEVIGREILDYCSYKGKVERLWLAALDDKSIQKGLKKLRPSDETEPNYWAGLARQRADWLLGMNLTRAFTLSGGGDVLNVGRVQTPTLSMIVARDLEIENFKSKPFYDVEASLSLAAGTLKGRWLTPKTGADEEGRCIEKTLADKVVAEVTHQSGRVVKAETTKKKEKQPLPMDLSTLQSSCSKSFGFSSKRTKEIAQSLYETHKVTTYPRSDCRYLPDSQKSEIKDVLAAIRKTDQSLTPLLDGADPNITSSMWNTKKVDEVGHNGIIPTLTPANISAMSADERNVYRLIAKHYIANFYPAYSYEQTTIEVEVSGHLFRTIGKVPVAQGWHVVLKAGAKAAKDELPKCSLNDAVQCDEAAIVSKQTTPPARYNEGTLILAMKNIGREITDPKWKKILKETSGIGTVATRDAIIDGLIKRGFVTLVKKKDLISTEKGRELIKVLPVEFTSPLMTAVWEQQFDEIVKGTRTLDRFLKDQVAFIAALINKLKSGDIVVLKSASAGGGQHKCPTCGGGFSKRKGKFGSFWSCNDRNCNTTAQDNRGKPAAPAPKPVLTDIDCPKCENGKLRKVKSRKGKEFLSCEHYPTCDHAQWPDSDVVKTGETCPRCEEGELVERPITKGKNKGKTFKGCNGYPKCDYTQWDN